LSIRYKQRIQSIRDPLLFLHTLENHRIKNGEIVKIHTNEGVRTGQVLMVNENVVSIQIIEGAAGITTQQTTCVFSNEIFKVGVSREMLGRTFNGLGLALKGKTLLPEKKIPINGNPINPYRREYPKDVIQTGISSFDCLNTLVRGQKLPIFSGQGLPHNKLIAQIVTESEVTTNEPFVVIFCGIGLLQEDALFFEHKFEEKGSSRVISFLNLASDPIIERLLVTRVALTTAEFLAFEHDMHVLVILNDMTNYAEALREVSNVKAEIPARKGFPGYMYSDFAALYERAGRIKGRKGSITQIPLISMPNDDISHPIPDLTGYITEGQIVLSRELHKQNLFPPIYPLSSLSRLMKDAIEGNTREDHADLASQLYFCYSRGLEVRELESIIGLESLSKIDKSYLKFSNLFEKEFIDQGELARSFTETLNLAWKILGKAFEKNNLIRIKKEYIIKYFPETSKKISKSKQKAAKLEQNESKSEEVFL
jgi:V/A-type H+/Na+-transporting ATPase subunit B